MVANGIFQMYFYAPVLDLTSVHILLVHGLDHVVTFDIIDVCTISQFTRTLLPGQLIIPQAFRLLQDCKAIGEPALRIISVLYTNFKRVLQYQVAESRDICKETGLTPFDVKLAKQSAGTWDSRDLVFFLKTLQKIEQGIKQGEIDEEIALDYLMVSIL